MFVTTFPLALPTLSRATARGVLSRARGVRWIVTIWCLLFTVSVFSATHFPDGQAADDALEAIEAVVDDAPGDVPVAKPSKGFERAIKVALGKVVKQPGQCFSVEHWVAQAHDVPDVPTSNAAAPDHASDAPELWLPPPPMIMTPGLRVARVRVALPPFQAGPTPAPMLRPPARA
ncbi:membrane protein [Ralstonia sp. A12]|uniref:hypothetical protein n=1 Tax=Ralstonia sp. A12 TaxID=1217052 RepID=UPI0005748014|nr:hypothetical protein [Ralstonia sp. A12]KHK52843.1 membrane protein [Ralstonia sp. A12]